MKDHNWQVVSLELSKELKKAGYPQEGLWWWNWSTEIEYTPDIVQGDFAPMGIDKAVTPTVAEMGEALPYRLRLPKDDYWLWQTKLKHGGTEIRYKTPNGSHFNPIQADTEANARAKMYLYLKKEKLI